MTSACICIIRLGIVCRIKYYVLSTNVKMMQISTSVRIMIVVGMAREWQKPLSRNDISRTYVCDILSDDFKWQPWLQCSHLTHDICVRILHLHCLQPIIETLSSTLLTVKLYSQLLWNIKLWKRESELLQEAYDYHKPYSYFAFTVDIIANFVYLIRWNKLVGILLVVGWFKIWRKRL